MHMRLIFPNGEHQEVDLVKGVFVIGAAADSAVQLAQAELQDHHATITVDHRGITLIAEGQSPAMQVNGRDVQEKAILRLGDCLRFGTAEMVLAGDQERLAATNEPGTVDEGNRTQPAKYLVRGLDGTHSGQAYGLYDRLEIGASSEIAVDGSARGVLQIEDGAVFLRDAQGVVVNGHSIATGALQTGDQLACGEDRFLLEAPGFVPGKAYCGVNKAGAGSGNTQVFTAPVVESAGTQPEAETRDVADAAGRRDALIVGGCIALSAVMLGWLLFVYLSR